jgi:hypothetical protein
MVYLDLHVTAAVSAAASVVLQKREPLGCRKGAAFRCIAAFAVTRADIRVSFIGISLAPILLTCEPPGGIA